MIPIPLWAISGAVAAVVAGAAGYGLASRIGSATLARYQAAWADERTQAAQRATAALEAEIRAHNEARNELEAIHATAQAERAVSQAQAASAAAALAAADRSSSRLRDSLETHRLATRAALAGPGAAGQCAAAVEAADMLRGLLGDFDAAAGRLADAARASSADADAQFAAARECAWWADAVSPRIAMRPP